MEERHEAIIELVREQAIEDQNTLVEQLQSQYGLTTTQAQVSRDLRRLGIGKSEVAGQMVYELKDQDETKELLRLAVKEVSHNENTIVIKTVAGLAPFVAYHLDQGKEIGVMATVAGEDALLVVPRSCEKIKEIFKAVCKAVFYKNR